MSRIEKLPFRLLSVPTDFTWDELVKVLNHFGYYETECGKTGGSRRKFVDENGNSFNLHKPHPEKIVKEYALKKIIFFLNLRQHIYEN
jgi:hypothetical protein